MSEPSNGAYLRPIGSKSVHTHHIQKTREALVEHGERVAEIPQAIDVRDQRVGFVCELNDGWSEKAKTMWGIRKRRRA